MRNVLPLLALIGTTALLTSGCVGAQEKLGRGVRNTYEVVRLGELRASMEQTAVWNSPTEAATTGVVKGVCHSVARTGVGIYEVVTFPIPPYHPVARKYLTPLPTYPDNYRSDLPNDPLYHTDQYVGFSGGTSFGFMPGCQFDPLGN